MAPVSYNRDGSGGGYVPYRDAYIRHAIYLSRYSTGEARKLLEILDAANMQIRGIISKAKAVETKEKYRRIAKEIRKIANETTESLDRQLRFDFFDLAGEETRFAEKALRAVNITAELDLPAPAKVWAAASFGKYAGDGHETFESYMDGLGDNLYKTWDANVRAGYLAGLTARQINRSVLGSVKDMYPGQMQALRQSLERNTRTMVSSLAETARDSVYRANSRLFSGYRYLGTLDARTCLACGGDDGKKFASLDEAPELPRHYNCRCLYVPVVKGMGEFDEGDERASVNGPVPAKTTYADWLKTQPDDVVREILGPARFQLYKDGMEITSFVSDGRTLTLHQLIEKEGLELFGAGLKDKSWQAQKAYSDTYYEAIRNRGEPTDIDKISKNTGFSRSDIQSVRNHVFIDEHDLGDGDKGRFASDWQIAQAWQRMEQGWKDNNTMKYQDYDILLLRHELEELTVMAKHGYNTLKAHELAEAKYPWDIKIGELK